MNNNFFKALEYEKSQQKKADDFYKKLFGDKLLEIKRWDYNEDECSRKMQQMGVDVTLTIKFTGRTFNNVIDKSKLNISYHISEKFRTKDWGDMLIELYSKFPETKGWGHHNAADYIVYFVGDNVYVIDNKELVSFVENISNDISENFLNNIFKTNTKKRYFECYKGKSINIIKTPTCLDDKEGWESVGVCVKWDDLKEFGIRIKKHEL